MKRFVLVFIALVFASVIAKAAFFQGALYGLACPNGGAYADGCAGAPAATFQQPNFFSTAPQSGQTYGSTRPPWNVAGVDYAVGTTTPIASLTDVASASISGCVWNPSYGSYAPALVCSSVVSPNISGLDFGPNAAFISSGGASGHDCAMLVLTSTVTGTAVIKNNHFAAGNPAASTASSCSGNSASWTGSYPLAASYPNGTIGGINPIIYANTNADIDVENNQFDGYYLNPCCSTPPVNKSGISAIDYLTSGAHTATIKYNVFRNFQGHSFSAAVSNSGTNIVMDYNYIEGWQSRSPSGHGENVNIGGTYNSFTGSFNTVLATKDMCFCSTGVFWMQSISGNTMNSMTLDHNTIATNNPGGASTSVIGTVSGSIDDGTGTNPGNVLTISSLTGGSASNIAVGDAILGSNYAVVIYANVSGSGIGSKWLVDCSNSSGTNTSGPCPNTNGANVTYIGPTSPYGVMNGTGYGLPVTLTSLTMKGGYANDAGSQIDHARNVTISIISNYIDPTGGYSGAVWGIGSDITCAVPTTFSGNIDLTTGTGTGVNAWSNSAGSTGC